MAGVAAVAPALGLDITVPYKPRRWALAFHQCLKRFGALVLHRRAGKTTCVINHHQRAAMDNGWERRRLLSLLPSLSDHELEELIHPPGGRHYGHIMPLRNQAKLVVWDKLKYYAGGIPGVKFNESELLVRYPTGHKFQLFGADDPDSLRGPAFSGLSFDEYSQQPPNIFSEVLSKALGDHLGYAVFVGTIKGKDHLFQTHAAAKDSDDWFALWQDIDRSIATEDDVTIKLLQQAMADDRKLIAQGLMTEEEYEQEWYLSTEAAIKGQWYQKELRKAKEQGRLTTVPYDPVLPVDTDWDLGMVDSMAIWFSQSTRSGEVRLIDYYEASGEGLPHFVGVMRAKGYTYGQHWAPHDIQIKEMSSGRSRLQVAISHGIPFNICPNVGVADGIHAVRLLFPKCWFDETKTARGLECLRQYRKRFNDSLQEFTGTPVHDWASHGADAFRYLAVRHQTPADPVGAPKPYKPRGQWQ
jgi:phage terminase large subunit